MSDAIHKVDVKPEREAIGGLALCNTMVWNVKRLNTRWEWVTCRKCLRKEAKGKK